MFNCVFSRVMKCLPFEQKAGSKWAVAFRDRVSDGPLLSEVIVSQPLRVTQMNEREQGDNKEESNQGMDWQKKPWNLRSSVPCLIHQTEIGTTYLRINILFKNKLIKKGKYVCDDDFYELSYNGKFF